ncbi:MAG: GNAT family N-acetyltransferase [Anaerolineae bacterium]|nr:GNAT family N-acetyltransferase [Anaerolineae bacterium]
MTQVQLIQLLEELTANAWPAEVVQHVDGWRLRFNGNVTRRANSVYASQAGENLSLEEKLTIVEEFYRRRNCPPRFHICPAAQPAHLDEFLAGRGYRPDARTAIQLAPLETVLARAKTNPNYTVTIGDTFDSSWFEVFCYGEHVKPHTAEVRRGILQRIGPRAGFATVYLGHQPVAVGLGVVERGWLGLFSLVTQPEYRRQGAATVLIHALACWGQTHQANQVYLQVMADNAPALALYARLGFETLYHYHYRELT